MKVLIACEFSGIVRDCFKVKGHDAWSCDIVPTDTPGNHIQEDVLTILNRSLAKVNTLSCGQEKQMLKKEVGHSGE